MTARLPFASCTLLILLSFHASYQCSAQNAPTSDAVLQAGPLASTPEQLRAWVERLENLPIKKTAAAEAATGLQATGLQDTVEDWIGLLSQTQLHFLPDGSIESTQWDISRVKTRDGATYLSQLGEDWSPGQTERPTMEARVLRTDQQVTLNDGQLAIDQAAYSDDLSMVTDARRLTLLLEGVEREAIVETKVRKLYRPLEGSTQGIRHALAAFNSCRLLRLKITAAAGVRPVIRCDGPELTPVFQGEADDELHVVYELTDAPSIFDVYESQTSADRDAIPLITAVLPGDWEQLGKTYAREVAKAIEAGDQGVRAWAAAAPKAADENQLQRVNWCVEKVRDSVRYTGLELGAQRIFPVAPDAVISRRFGDCKDQSTLLVALLNQLGIKAHVALLSTGTGLDVPSDLPCWDFFDHAIVYVDSLDLWIDVTAEMYPAGLLPAADCGRRALICAEVGSRLTKIPTRGAEQDVLHQTHVFRVNFSGGGDLCVQLDGTGPSAIQLHAGYHTQPAATLIETWRQYLKQTIGIEELASLQRGQPDELHYAVRARAAPTQTFNRNDTTTILDWDASELLDGLPTGFGMAWDEATGKLTPGIPRQSAWQLNAGMTHIHEFRFYFPQALELEEVPENWIRRQGQLAIERECRLLKETAEMHGNDQLELEELVPDAQLVRPEWARLHDRLLIVRYALRFEAGEMSAEGLNDCRKLVEEQFNSGQLAGQVNLKWNEFSPGEAADNSSLPELAQQAKTYSELFDPLAALASHLATFGLPEFAHELTKDIQQLDASYSLSRSLLTQQRLNRGYPHDHLPALRELNAGHELFMQYPDRLLAVQALLTGPGGMRTVDPTQLKQAEQVIEACINESTFAALPLEMQQLMKEFRIYVDLSLRNDPRVLALLNQETAPYSLLMKSAIEEKTYKFPAGFTVDDQQFLDILLWQTFISAGRFDLAEQLQQVRQTTGSFKLSLSSEQPPQLAKLNRSDPESVARHAILAMLSHDSEKLRTLLGPQMEISQLVYPPWYQPAALRYWCLTDRAGYSVHLMETLAALAPSVMTEVGEQGVVVEFPNPFDSESLKFELQLVKTHDSQEWAVVPGVADLALQLLSYVESDQPQEAAAWLKQVTPAPKARFLGLFSDDSDLTESQRIWRRIDSADPTQIALAVRAFASESNNDLSYLEPWLTESHAEIPANCMSLVNDIRTKVWKDSGDFSAAYPLVLKTAQSRLIPVNIYALLQVIQQDRLAGGVLHQDNLWREVVSEYVTQGADNSTKRRFRMHVYAIDGQWDQAFEIITAELDKRTVDEHRRWENSFLWESLISEASDDVLEQRIALVKQLPAPADSVQNVPFRHTLACAHGKLGNVAEALQLLQQIEYSAGDRPENDLVRGYILNALGYSSAAVDYFSRARQSLPFSDTAYLASLELKLLEPE